MNHEVVGELYYDGDWQQAPVYSRAGVDLSRGAGEQDDESSPSAAGLELDNRDGTYSPRNPLSPLYGLAGRNTPMRIRCGSAQASLSDTFTRTVADDWGQTTPGGYDWVTAGTTGSAANHDVNGTQATVTVGANSTYRIGWVEDNAVSYEDCEAYAEVTIPAATGGALEPTLMLRMQSPNDYYQVRAWVAGDIGEIDIMFRKNVAAVDSLIGTQAINVSAHVAANPIKIRAQIVGSTLRAKVWQGAVEPTDWQATERDTDITGPGWIGLRSGIGAGNTNAKPVTFTWDNLSASPINIRSTTEVSSWGLQRDASGVDRSTALQGGGILRRFGQGSTPLRSVAYQSYMAPENSALLVDYWPLEEESEAASLGSPIGSTPMGFGGTLTFGGDTESSPSSARLITFGSDGFLFATLRSYSSTLHRTHSLWTLPTAGLTDQAIMMRLYLTGGSIGIIDLVYGLPNALTLKLYNLIGVSIGNSGPWGPFNIDGNHFLLTVDLSQDGADVDTNIGAAFVDDSAWLGASSTFAGQTIGRIADWTIGQTSIDGAAVGHMAVGNSTAAFSNFIVAEGGIVGVKGYRDEPAGVRFLRIASDLGLPARVIGDPDDTQLMGAQPVDTGAEVMQECVRTDDALLFEPRNDRAVVMRTGRDRYNQASALDLNFTGSQIAPGIAPQLDDRHTRNDVTASRPRGSSARAVRESGPMNVNDPLDDPNGVGRYEHQVDVNTNADAALIQQASWHMEKGTVDEPRYPEVTVDLDRAPSLRAAVDAVEIGDRITIDNLPADWQQELGNLLVLGIKESFPPGLGGRRRTVTFNTVPASIYEIGIVGANDGSTDLRGQAVDTDLSTTNEVLDTTETGVDVASTGGVVWTTDADDWSSILNGNSEFAGGLHIIIGGEVMRITNISGASSPQTFTVVRSVNGVVKGHALGVPVHVFRPARVGL